MYVRIRQADTGDALHVAAIVDIAGHGIDLDCWMKARDGDQSVMSAARRLVIEDHEREHHYSKAHVIEVDNGVAGGLIGGSYPGMTAGMENNCRHILYRWSAWKNALSDIGISSQLQSMRNIGAAVLPPASWTMRFNSQHSRAPEACLSW